MHTTHFFFKKNRLHTKPPPQHTHTHTQKAARYAFSTATHTQKKPLAMLFSIIIKSQSSSRHDGFILIVLAVRHPSLLQPFGRQVGILVKTPRFQMGRLAAVRTRPRRRFLALGWAPLRFCRRRRRHHHSRRFGLVRFVGRHLRQRR